MGTRETAGRPGSTGNAGRAEDLAGTEGIVGTEDTESTESPGTSEHKITGFRKQLAEQYSEESKNKINKEAVAKTWIRLHQLAPENLTENELQEAAKYCKLAAYACIYGSTGNIDLIPLYSSWARHFNDLLGEKADPLVELQSYNIENIRLQKLGLDWGDTIRKSFKARRALREQLPDIPDQTETVAQGPQKDGSSKNKKELSADEKEKCDNYQRSSRLLLWGLALLADYHNRRQRALNLIDKSLALDNKGSNDLQSTKKISGKLLKSLKIKIHLLLKLDKKEKARQLADFILEKNPKTSGKDFLDLARIFLQEEDKEAHCLGRDMLARFFRGKHVPGSSRNTEAPGGRQAQPGEILVGFYLLLKLALENDKSRLSLHYYEKLQTAIETFQQRFLFPENLSGFLGKYTSVYDMMFDYHFDQDNVDTCLRIIADSFWNTSLPGQETGPQSKEQDRAVSIRKSITENAAMSGTRFHSSQRNFQFPLRPDQEFWLFYSTEKYSYWLQRRPGKKDAWNIREYPRAKLTAEIKDFRTLCQGSQMSDTFFNSARKDIEQKYFRSDEIGPNCRELLVFANYPFSTMPWSTFFPEHTVIFCPALDNAEKREAQRTQTKGRKEGRTIQQSPAGRKSSEPPAGHDVLSFSEDGSTLRQAPIERAMLQKVFPGGKHLVAEAKNGEKSEEQEAKKKPLKTALQKARIFHFAGHGFSHRFRPENSGLLLQGDPLSGGTVLTLREIAALDLANLELVFLNSCSSGHGAVYAGELYQHAGEAFLQAGVHSLIVSLFPIADAAGLHFSTRFYKKLEQSDAKPPSAVFAETLKECASPQTAAAYLFIRNPD